MFGINFGEYFLFSKGLYALIALVPFLLLYLIKPKPRKIIIPSLMFFLKDKGKSNLNSFLQKFLNDFLFYLQLIVLLLLIAAIAKPFLNVPSIEYADSMVFVIDASASMNAVENGKTRFERAKDIAKEKVRGKNTIILATDSSQIIVENAGIIETEDAFASLKARETTSSLYDAIVLAENYIVSEKSAVFVLSDFTSTRLEKEFFRAKSYLEAKGIDVFFEDVSLNKAENVGIIDLDVKDTEIKAWIKNYGKESRNVKIKYGGKEVASIDINGEDVKKISIPEVLNGKSTIELEVDDDLKLDNYAYISTPEEASIDIMLITNDDEKYLKIVLGLMQKITVHENKPPIVNFNNPDLIILGNVNKKVLIPGDISKIKKLVKEDGIPLIILAQDDILSIGLNKLFPVELIKNDPVSIEDTIVPTNPGSSFTPAEIQFGIVRKIYQIKGNDNINVHAETSTNKYPAIMTYTHGKGGVLYYGLFDDHSEFKSDIFYPVFWKRMIDYLIGSRTLAEINKRTGHIVFLARDQLVKTPQDDRQGKAITLDYCGFYDFPDYTMTANLLSEEEQRLNKDKISTDSSKLPIETEKRMSEKKEKEVTKLFIIMISILLLAELLFIKFRGDI